MLIIKVKIVIVPFSLQNTCETIIFPFVLHYCEMWSLTVRKHKLKVV